MKKSNDAPCQTTPHHQGSATGVARKQRHTRLLGAVIGLLLFLPLPGFAQETGAEEGLGEFVVTGVAQEHRPTIAILPAISFLHEDIVVRNVVRRDLELSGIFRVIDDSRAPEGDYDFSAPVELDPWQAIGAEAIVKVAARKRPDGLIDVLGLAYFPQTGSRPIYQHQFRIEKTDVRRTAHRITDALVGALTGRPSGFASQFAFSSRWGRHHRISTADADGHSLHPKTGLDYTALAPQFNGEGELFFVASKNYSPFKLTQLRSGKEQKEKLRAHESPLLQLEQGNDSDSLTVELPFDSSIYSFAFSKDESTLVLAVAEPTGSNLLKTTRSGAEKLYAEDFENLSETAIATQPTFSTSGRIAWVGGGARKVAGQTIGLKSGPARIYLDGKPVSPAGYSAASPEFCDTELGTVLLFSVEVSPRKSDLFLVQENGSGLRRLTQNQGSNTYPACSPDGRLVAYFSDRKENSGLYLLSLKRGISQKVMNKLGQGLTRSSLPAHQEAESPVEIVKPPVATPQASSPPPPPAIAAPITEKK